MSVFRIRAIVGFVGAAAAAGVALVLPPSVGPAAAETTNDVVLTNADDGRTVAVSLGQRLRVDLQSGNGDYWADIVSESALHRSHIDVASERATATFTALSPTTGQHVSASTDLPCFHSEPVCAAPQRQWQVTVVVGNSPSPAPTASPQQCMRRPVPSIGPNTVLVEERHEGQTVQVPLNWRVQVVFPGCKDSGVDYQPAKSDGPLYRESVSADNPGGAVSIFRAVSRGTTTLTAVLDAPCLHEQNGCAVVAKVWQVTIEVGEPRGCELTGPVSVPSGSTVVLTGRGTPGAAVQVWFRQRGSAQFVVRRQLTAASGGTFTTSYVGNDDYRWYATADGCTTPVGLTQVTSWVRGPRYAARGSHVSIDVHAPASVSVALYMRATGGAFRLARTGRTDGSGNYRTTYVAQYDQRYYAVTGPEGRQTAWVLTQVD